MITTTNRISELMKEQNISYRELADLTNISKSALNYYANGNAEKMPISRVKAIAQALHTTPAYLMGLEDDPQEKTIDDQIMALIASLNDEQKKTILEVAKQLNKNN